MKALTRCITAHCQLPPLAAPRRPRQQEKCASASCDNPCHPCILDAISTRRPAPAPPLPRAAFNPSRLHSPLARSQTPPITSQMFKKLQQQLAAKLEAGSKSGALSGKQLSVGARVVKVDRLLGEGEWLAGPGPEAHPSRRPLPPPARLPASPPPGCLLHLQVALPPSTAAPMWRAARPLPSSTSS